MRGEKDPKLVHHKSLELFLGKPYVDDFESIQYKYTKDVNPKVSRNLNGLIILSHIKYIVSNLFNMG